ncbi:MAG: hypothetical protein D6712_09315 [Chloroflexi bacterium]|nr:MAG: hypothetical protein D6712_09315 [Chloroflexota bacterium]
MTQTVHHDLAALRQAATERNPEQVQFLLKRLFLGMNFYRALAVAVERAFAFVETFERYYPEAVWARQVILQIANLGTVQPLPPQAMRDFTAPGAANFMKALADLANSVQQSNQYEARIGYLVSATVNAITAALVATYYQDRIEDWERLRTADIDPLTGHYADPQVTQIAYAFWTDEAVEKLDIDTWLAVADAIERHLQRE